MEIVCTPKLRETLVESYLLVDTCTIIDASKCPEVYGLLKEIRQSGCVFASVKAVRDEYTCSASNLQEYEELLTIYSSLKILELPRIDQLMLEPDGAYFNMALSRCRNIHPSYVDRLLLFATYFYGKTQENMYFITSNHKDVPSELFDCSGFITHNIGGFHNIGVYKTNVRNISRTMKGVSQNQIAKVQEAIKRKEGV